MIKLLSAALLVFSTSPAFSFDLQSVNAENIAGTPPAAGTPAAQKAASQFVWMSVRQNVSMKEAQADDWGARIEARVRETFKDSYSVSLRADMDSSWGSIRKSGSSHYSLSGSGLFLSMSGSNGSYFINGSVTDKGKTVQVNVNVSKRFDDNSFNVSGFGLHLYTDKNSINGNYDPDSFSRKAVAAVTSLLLAVQVEKGKPGPEEKSASDMQRVWLTIRPDSGWNTVEADDPFFRLEVGLRKIFDREYDAEIETGNSRISGRVSGFFTRRYELRAGKTRLLMEEWAGNWEITGKVEVDGPGPGEIGVKLELRDRFGDGSFYIWEDGIRLNIDRNSISGEVDTNVYPREVIGAITALVMAYQQIHPDPASPHNPR